MAQQRQAEKDYAAEAAKQGMTLSDTSYSIAGRGLIYVATDRPQGSFQSVDAYVNYVYENRHDKSKVQFLNIDLNNRYGARSEQDLLAREIARQADVEIVPPFQREARRAEETERRETVIARVNYEGSAVRIEIDVSDMRQAERDSLRQDMEQMGPRPDEDALSTFIDRHHSSIEKITVRGREVDVADPRSTITDINRIAGREV
ncbi:MAG: hypothetical protein WC350_03180 [Candidatus Micrarchaeia archaeon]|jgi:hypothetical protein